LRHPEELFDKKPDELSINIEDSIVIESHIQCAAEESSINTVEDQAYFGASLPSICAEHLVEIDQGVRNLLSNCHIMLRLFFF
jgi:DEAD/DEAH box helicase domain-containing protein